MQKVLTAEQMREVDRLTTERYGIPSIILMENAAHAVARVITEKLGGSVRGHDVVVLCGKGNNGGDGAALARYLWTQWCDVDVHLFGSVDDSKGDARTNFEILRSLSLREPPFYPAMMLYENASWNHDLERTVSNASIIIDALFGTGLTRPLDESYKHLFDRIEEMITKKKIRPLLCSIDIPSGLNADSASGFEPSFRPDITVSITSPKPGNVLPPNCNRSGELFVGDIGTPYEMLLDCPSHLMLSEPVDVREWLRNSRYADASYKNKRGHSLIIAGSDSYSGAAVLCGDAAMRSGVGLVTIATPRSSKDSIALRVLPEVMVKGVAETGSGSVAEEAFEELHDLLEKADSVAIGSGLSLDGSTKRFVEKIVLNRKQPTIVDADALTLLSPFEETMQRPAREQGLNTPAGDQEATENLASNAAQLTKPAREQGRDRDVVSYALAHARTSASDACNEPPLILTPHEGEFMRLLGITDKDAIKDRVAAVREFATTHNVILVLKGERVLIGEPGGKVVVNPTGNSGLGKAGNGDTLTGILAGFVAQAVQMEIDIFETVVAAVYVAGMAGDIAEKKYGKRVMSASDVRECLADVFEQLAAN